MKLPWDARIVLTAFTVSGVVHLVKPEVFEPLMPRQLPAHRELIIASGVAELACAAGLAVPRTRRWAGYASAVLLVAVFPGNVKMAVDASRTRRTGLKALAWGRLPLQAPLIRGALRAARLG
jgi:uncharacterized membrane protein